MKKLLSVLLATTLMTTPVFAQGKAAANAPAPAKKVISKAAATANPIAVFQTFTITDLQAALADAQSANDTAAVTCYSALIPIVQTPGIGNPLPTGLGAFQLLQKGRDLKANLAALQAPNGPLAQLNVACASLIIDAQNTLIQLGILGGGVAVVGATGGISLPSLPALIAGIGL